MSLPQLHERYIRGCDRDNPLNANYPYTPRDGRTKAKLDELFRQERPLLIVGKSGVGKTREALELLKRHRHRTDTILEIEHLAIPYSYVPPSGDVVLLINDLPGFFPEGASSEVIQEAQTTLKGMCDYLERRTRSLFVLATARTDMGQLERTGCKPDGFWCFYDLPYPNREEAVGNFVDAVVGRLGITLSNDARQTLIRQHLELRDGTCQGIIEYVEDKRGEGVARLESAGDYLGYIQNWDKRYRALVEEDEAIRCAFGSLSVLRQVRADPYEFLVAELGGRLMPIKWRNVRTWTPRGRKGKVKKAIEQLVDWKHLERLDSLLLCHPAKLDGKGDWRERVEVMANVLLGMATGRRACCPLTSQPGRGLTIEQTHRVSRPPLHPDVGVRPRPRRGALELRHPLGRSWPPQ